jgi:ATP-dependent Clp protease protease subunit
MILSAGTKGFRASLPNATIVLHQARRRAPYSQATDIQIHAKEVFVNKEIILDILAANTSQQKTKIAKDMDRMYYMTPHQAKEYGLIDKVLESAKDLPQPLAVAR